jgi:Flp pilus assembly protein TadD
VNRRWILIAWPLATLLVFTITFRRAPADRESSAASGGSCTTTQGDARSRTIAELESCLALDTGDVEAMLSLASAYEAARRGDDAEAMYRRALTIEPHDARAHVALGRLLLARGKTDDARREGETALRWHVGSAAAERLVAEARGR